ncbi:uncharacterized protein N7458_000934 [Penicillium daleae]|uniref:Uncharacterized protein n=1 Tax=Penicillium daleae TaxID=63821 RepID=A0AAD6CHK9_9EURO|nr:uncharacterized protein N7458_000934 [Penicillium daleae]KAJ5465248.1 hypothetical protein N7458_000934 [Penicillium daleae]
MRRQHYNQKHQCITASVVDAECDAFPSYIRVLPENLSRHLLEKHRLQASKRGRIASSSELDSVATSNAGAVQLPDGREEIHGLPTVFGRLLKELGPSYYLPRVQDEPSLFLICESIGQVLEKTMTVLVHDQNVEARYLSRRKARLVNTFTRRETSQDPITELQNQQSRRKYIDTWQRLICYWDRLEAWCEVTEAASELTSRTDPDSDEVNTEAFHDRLDRAVLEFSQAIIQHSVRHCKFDSVFMSYAAVRFWSHKQGARMLMVVLAQVVAEAEDDRDTDTGAMIVDIRDQWLLNDTEGPVVELQENRLPGFRIGETGVPPAQLRWHADGETLLIPRMNHVIAHQEVPHGASCLLAHLTPLHSGQSSTPLRVMSDQDADLHIAFDPGTTTWTVCWKWSCSLTVHTLKFSSTYSEKDNEELDATVGRSQSNWHYGLDVRYLDVQKFENIKLGILGQEPYTSELKQSFQATARAYGAAETPATLFENLFKHILATLAERYLEVPESEGLIRGRRFQDIRKHCWVTYPVRHNNSLRIILFEAALAAGFNRVEGVSESMAAAHFVALHTKGQLFTVDKTALIGDCGGGSTDFVGVRRELEGWIRQAWLSQGGLMVNRAFQEWLYDTFSDKDLLTAPRSWPTISFEFEGCKRVFNGVDPVHLDVFGERIQISVETMTGFFQDLIEGILRVFWDQYTAAQDQGHAADFFFLCGGPARNKWFAKSIFDEIQKREPNIMCAAETHVGTVAQGALSFAHNPIRETSVAGEDVGLTFLMDRSVSGVELSGDRVEEAIGWVIEKGQPAGDGSRVELIKTVYRDRPGRPNRVISSDLYTTNDQFNRANMRSDHDVDWDCRITYPLVGVHSHLVYLGRIEANIPHDELFPASTTHREIEARFIFSIKPEGQLLKVEVLIQRENDSLLLTKSYVPAASWIPQSELDLEPGHHDGTLAFFPRAKRRRRDKRGRRVLSTMNTNIREDPPVATCPAITPASLVVPFVGTENEIPSVTVDHRPVENDNSANGISLPPGRKIVRHSLGPRNMAFLLSPPD